MQELVGALKKYGNHNLSKVFIEPKNCRPPHMKGLYFNFIRGYIEYCLIHEWGE